MPRPASASGRTRGGLGGIRGTDESLCGARWGEHPDTARRVIEGEQLLDAEPRGDALVRDPAHPARRGTREPRGRRGPWGVASTARGSAPRTGRRCRDSSSPSTRLGPRPARNACGAVATGRRRRRRGSRHRGRATGETDAARSQARGADARRLSEVNEILNVAPRRRPDVDPVVRTLVAGVAMMLETSVLVGLVVPGDNRGLVAGTAIARRWRGSSSGWRRDRIARRREPRLLAGRSSVPASAPHVWARSSATATGGARRPLPPSTRGSRHLPSRFLPRAALARAADGRHERLPLPPVPWRGRRPRASCGRASTSPSPRRPRAPTASSPDRIHYAGYVFVGIMSLPPPGLHRQEGAGAHRAPAFSPKSTTPSKPAGDDVKD